MTSIDVLTSETMHRGAKLFMDRGDAVSYGNALDILRRFRLQIAVGPEIAASEAAQVALLTAVNIGHRAFLGGVRVTGCAEGPSLTPLAGGWSLRQAITSLGGMLVDYIDPDIPLVLIGDVEAPPGNCPAWRATWDGWTGGAVPVSSGIRLAEAGKVHLAAVLAAAAAIGEAFQLLSCDCAYGGRRAVGLSLWNPLQNWLDQSSVSPEIGWLPSRLWLIGVGNLGQTYLWCLGAMPYAKPCDVRLVVQDDDVIEPSNESTSLLSHRAIVGMRKARAIAWAERIGFVTIIEERRFGTWTHRSDEAEDPAVALCGVDNAHARMALEDAGFSLVVEAGLGAGPQGYRSLSIHTFPARRTAREVWRRVLNATAATDPSLLPAYRAAIATGMDQCGVAMLASRTVGVPFVGAIAAALAISELLRRIHGGIGCETVAATMACLEEVEFVPAGPHTPYLFGTTVIR